MSGPRRVRVVSQAGRLVGVHVPDDTPPADPKSPIARLVAGPKQKLHEIDVEVPVLPVTRKAVTAFHALIRRRLKLRK
jgi:hypothetical protein